MELKQLARTLRDAAGAGVDRALETGVVLSPLLTRAQAYSAYGRGSVDRWVAEGLLKFSGKHIDRNELARVADCSNRRTYLPVADR